MTPVPVPQPLFVLVAGEASGDQLAGPLIPALRRRYPGARFAGIGGPRMRQEGFEAWWDIEELSVMGLGEVVSHLPRLLRLRRELAARILRERPCLLLGIDAPDFNLGLEQRVRAAGIPTAHYVSPNVWAWRRGRVRRISRSASLLLCLFPFEPQLYAGHGVQARFTGHPMADEIDLDNPPGPARAALGLNAAATVVALLPGSRGTEVRRMAAPLLDAAAELSARRPGVQFVAPMTNARMRGLFEAERAKRPALDCLVTDGHARLAMAAADVVACASGTAALECLLVNRPLVVAYRVSAFTRVLVRTFKLIRSPWVSLPNALAGEMLVPELIQERATGPAIATALETWLDDAAARAALRQRFTAIHQSLRIGAADAAAAASQEFMEASGNG